MHGFELKMKKSIQEFYSNGISFSRFAANTLEGQHIMYLYNISLNLINDVHTNPSCAPSRPEMGNEGMFIRERSGINKQEFNLIINTTYLS